MPARLALALVFVLSLSGCDLFGERESPLSFRTLVQSDTLVAGPADSEGGVLFDTVVILRTQADAAQFAQSYALSGLLPEVDFRTESVVGYIGTAGAAGGRVTIAELALLGDDALKLRIETTGLSRPAETPGPTTRFPLHFVVTPPLQPEVAGWSIRFDDF